MTKNLISREMCGKDLKHLTKADLYSDVVLLVVMLLLFVPLAFLGVYLSKYILILGIACTVICAIAPVTFIVKLINNIKIVRLVSRGGFSVVKDTVSRLSKGEVVGRNSTADIIYFAVHGRYIPSQSTFDMTSVGDEFYLVVLHTSKRTPMFAFHSMIYEYKE